MWTPMAEGQRDNRNPRGQRRVECSPRRRRRRTKEELVREADGVSKASCLRPPGLSRGPEESGLHSVDSGN